MLRSYADLPLHYGSCPSWLFKRMKKLGKAISQIIVFEFGTDEFLKRLSDPFFFQSLACVLGFDWHSSGVTTTVCGALKESLNSVSEELGLAIAGGKGKTSRKTPEEIKTLAEKFSLSTSKIESLTYASKMSAKIDNAAVQDNYNLYHHVFVFNEKSKWCVIQQGMNYTNKFARRYHWLSENIESFVLEPHNAICCDTKHKDVLNMVSKQSKETQKISLDLVKDNVKHFQNDFKAVKLKMPAHHNIRIADLNKRTLSTLKKAHEIQPKNYEELLAIRGVGPKTIQALALVSEIIYGKPASWKDPVKYSFSHGGKDGTPYPVNRKRMDESIEILNSAIKNAKLGNKEKLSALKRLSDLLWFP